MIENDSLETSDDSILLPMCNLFPANQIISKKYQPDKIPIIKLITQQSISKKQDNFNKNNNIDYPKIIGPNYTQYAKLFSSNDFLGKYYADQIQKLVYLKFNNKDYNQLKVNEKKYRFFSGFFIEPQFFTENSSESTKRNNQNFMKSFPFIDFIDYNQNILQSFGKNTFGSSYDPRFSSNYDSANLFAVIKKKPFEYDLILQNDINSKGNTQWFNFLVNFAQEGVYKFNIVNFTKNNSLYEKGMRIACYSFLKQSYRGSNDHKTGLGWFRTGNNIRYYKNNILRQSTTTNQSYYTLSFEYNCKNRSQSIIFSHSVPYNSLDLEKYFNRVLYRRISGHFKIQKIQICNSLSGQPINSFMISHRKLQSSSLLKVKKQILERNNLNSTEKKRSFNLNRLLERSTHPFPQNSDEMQKIKSVILMARQHSGETQSSFVIEGMVDYLLSNSELDQVKKNYLFFIMPMINVDGVKFGHYRTNLCGTDLNRIWRHPRKQYHPEVYYTKKFLYELNRSHPVSLILDIHGHSKSLNSFFYGNPSKKQNNNHDDAKIFPFLCSKRIKQVSYKQSTFHIKEDKKNSARVVLGQMFPRALVYTLENSFYGFEDKRVKLVKEKKQAQKEQQQQTQCIINQTSKLQCQQQYLQQKHIIEYTPDIYRRIGRELMTTYLQYVRLCQRTEKNTKSKWMKQIESIYCEISKLKTYENKDSDDGGSDSEIENQLVEIEFKQSIRDRNKFQSEKSKNNVLRSPMVSKNQQTKKFISRKAQKKKTMPLPKTICQQSVSCMSSVTAKPFTTLKDLSKSKNLTQNKQNKLQNLPDFFKKTENTRSVLSIFKIQTKKTSILKKQSSMKNILQTDKNSQSSNSLTNLLKTQPSNLNMSLNKTFKQDQTISVSSLIKNKDKLMNENKDNVDEALKKYSGMKTFLKAMGIIIDNKRN